MISDCHPTAERALYWPRHFPKIQHPMPKMPPPSPKNFEAALAELDLLVEKMESGQLLLEESLSAYQRGAELLKFCEGVLKDVEQKVKVLDGGELKNFTP